MSAVAARKVKSITTDDLLDELRAFVGLCFVSLHDLDMKEISNLSHLSLPTLYNLKRGHFSLDVRHRTLVSLGVAAGIQFKTERFDRPVRLK